MRVASTGLRIGHGAETGTIVAGHGGSQDLVTSAGHSDNWVRTTRTKALRRSYCVWAWRNERYFRQFPRVGHVEFSGNHPWRVADEAVKPRLFVRPGPTSVPVSGGRTAGASTAELLGDDTTQPTRKSKRFRLCSRFE